MSHNPGSSHDSKDITDPPTDSLESHRNHAPSRTIDYSGAGYTLSDDEDETPLVKHRRGPSTSWVENLVQQQPAIKNNNDDDNNNNNASSASQIRPKPKSLIRRLASIKRPKPDIRATINPRRDRYSVLELDDVHNDIPPEDRPGVDISLFEGFPVQFQSPSSPDDARKKDCTRTHTRTDSDTTDAGPSESVRKISFEIDPAASKGMRSRSIRKQGQDLANKTKTIVSVDKRDTKVDLSVLEGLSPNASDSPNFGKQATTLTNQSFFYPLDPEQPNWKPISMRSSYIIMLVIVSLALAGVQEYLWQKSWRLEARGHGLIPYDKVTDISQTQFFCWKYLPTLVTVCYGVLWQVTDYEVQRLEPYYQLSQPTGNTAEKGLNLDYVTMWSYFVPIKAIKYRHWTVLVSAIGTILATTAVPSLQAPSIKPKGNPICPGSDPNRPDSEIPPCPDGPKFFLRVHPVWSRLVTACLGLVAVLAIILLFQLRRKSGLLTDPLGVAGVAAMANRSHILAEFQGMDESLHDDIHEKLRHRRYILYKSTIWKGEYTDEGEEDKADDDNKSRKPPNPQPIILRPIWLLSFIIFMSICLPFVPAVSYDHRLQTFIRKVPWLPVLIATLIKQLWATLEFNVKMLEPFHTLSRGSARPDQTITLDYQGTPYGLIIFKALLNRHWLVALVGFGAILSDLLTVTFSSLALRTETPESFYSSSTISIVIVIFMIASAVTVFIRRRCPFMPRQPSTIASILAFIHQSQMLEDFTGTERYTNSQMQEMLVERDKRYGLGWFKGRDSRTHCAIDQEPMLSRYVHGVSYRRACAPWEENV